MKLSTLLIGIKMKINGFIRPYLQRAPRIPRSWDSPGEYLGHELDRKANRLCITLTGGIYLVSAAPGGVFKVSLNRPADPDLLSASVLPYKNEPLVVTNPGDGSVYVHTEKDPQLVCAFNILELTFSFLRDEEILVVEETSPGIHKNWVAASFRSPCKEKYIGFGQKTGGLYKNNQKLVMWNMDDPHIHTASDPIYQSCPLQIAIRKDGTACGLFFDNPHYSLFCPGDESPQPRSTYTTENGPLCYYLLPGPELKDVLKQYTQLTGTYPLPPRWVLGHHHSRWEEEESTERVLQLAEDFQKHQLPCDVIHLDIGHLEGYRCFTWNKKRFPDPAGVIKKLHARGFKIVVIVDPGLKKDEKWAIYREGVREGMFCRRKNGRLYHGPVWPGDSAFVNYTSARASKWWGDLYKIYTDLGIDGFWNDMNEPSVFRARNTMSDDVLFTTDDGREYGHRTMHNLFSLLMIKASAGGIRRQRPGKRWFLFSRSSFAGIQRYASTWTGDNSSNWDHLRMSIPMLLNMGLSGQVMSGPDTGGFWKNPTEELMIRWLQLATFYPFSRNHTSLATPPQELWSMGEKVLSQARTYLSLRYSLLPYLYTQLAAACRSGLPFMQPLFLTFPRDPRCQDLPFAENEFMCGPQLLIAPVCEAEQREKKLYLPAGSDWVDWWNNKVYAGGKRYTIPAALETLPFFARSGSVIPMGKTALKTEKVSAGPLILEVFPGETLQGEVYLDDGFTTKHQEGEFCRLSFAGEAEPGKLSLEVKQKSGSLWATDCLGSGGIRLRIRPVGKTGFTNPRIIVKGKELPADSWKVKGKILEATIVKPAFPFSVQIENRL